AARAEVFPILTVIEQTHREETLPATTRGYARDTITLGWEDRLHVHGRRRSDGGVAFGLSLPRGTMLRGGDCLVVAKARTVVVVAERPGRAFLTSPRTPQEWALFAYHTGNRHQPIMITDGAIVCLMWPASSSSSNGSAFPSPARCSRSRPS